MKYVLRWTPRLGGSGTRQGSEFWEHQGEVTVDISGAKFVCRTP